MMKKAATVASWSIIDWNKAAEEIERAVRGLYPWPCACTTVGDKNIKIVEAEVVDVADTSVDIGKVCEVTKKYFVIRCGEKGLKIKKLQPEGKKLMETVAFLNGYKVTVGM